MPVMTPDEFLNIVRRHERYVNGWVGGAREDLSHQELSGLRLANVILQKAQLRGIDFSDCDLTGADLFRARFERAASPATNFSDADLRGARFAGAMLSGSHFCGADMRPGLSSPETREFDNTDLNDATLDRAKLEKARLPAGRHFETRDIDRR
jgi:uncharacterized protein YjbI with pentapeptide repeats